MEGKEGQVKKHGRSRGEGARKHWASSFRVKRMGLRADRTGKAAQGPTAQSLD